MTDACSCRPRPDGRDLPAGDHAGDLPEHQCQVWLRARAGQRHHPHHPGAALHSTLQTPAGTAIPKKLKIAPKEKQSQNKRVPNLLRYLMSTCGATTLTFQSQHDLHHQSYLARHSWLRDFLLLLQSCIAQSSLPCLPDNPCLGGHSRHARWCFPWCQDACWCLPCCRAALHARQWWAALPKHALLLQAVEASSGIVFDTVTLVSGLYTRSPACPSGANLAPSGSAWMQSSWHAWHWCQAVCVCPVNCSTDQAGRIHRTACHNGGAACDDGRPQDLRCPGSHDCRACAHSRARPTHASGAQQGGRHQPGPDHHRQHRPGRGQPAGIERLACCHKLA